MRGNPDPQTDFRGGLRTDGAPYELEANRARDCLNVTTNPAGQLRKREGFATHATLSTGGPTLIHSLAAANLGTKLLLAHDDTGRCYKITSGASATSLATGLSTSARWSWAQMATGGTPTMYGVNGLVAKQYDGTTFGDWTATTGTVPFGTLLVYHGSRLWMAGTTAAGTTSRLYYSGITGTAPDPLNWDANNYVDIEPDDGEQITALGTAGPNLLVFKPRKCYVMYDVATGANRKLSAEIGCPAPRSVVETPEGTFFLSEDSGVWSTDGERLRRKSDLILPTIQAAATSPTTYQKAAACWWKNRYYLSLSVNAVKNDRILEYEPISDSWWLHDAASNQFAILDPVSAPTLYSANPAGPTTQEAFKPGIYQDAGVNYSSCYWNSSYYVWGEPHVVKNVREIRVDGVGDWQTSVATDFREVFAPIDGEVWDSGTDTSGLFGGAGNFGGTGTFGAAFIAYANRRYYTPAIGRSVSLKISNSDANDFRIYSLTFALTGRKD